MGSRFLAICPGWSILLISLRWPKHRKSAHGRLWWVIGQMGRKAEGLLAFHRPSGLWPSSQRCACGTLLTKCCWQYSNVLSTWRTMRRQDCGNLCPPQVRGHIDLDTHGGTYIYIYIYIITPAYPPTPTHVPCCWHSRRGFFFSERMTSLEISDMYFVKFDVFC